MKLYLIIGPMFSGKTSFIIEKFNQHNTLAIKPIIDNRYNTKEIVSHDNIKIPCISISFLCSLINKIDFNQFKNIIIDEGQFFKDIANFINMMDKYHINIYVAALNGDFNRKPFDVISTLYSRADEIFFKQGKCYFCNNKSSFSLKFDVNTNSLNSQIDVGGCDKYHPVCGSCYLNSLKKHVSHKLLEV